MNKRELIEYIMENNVQAPILQIIMVCWLRWC